MIDKLLEAILAAPLVRLSAADDSAKRSYGIVCGQCVDRHHPRHDPSEEDASAIGQDRNGERHEPQLERGPQFAADARGEFHAASSDGVGRA